MHYDENTTLLEVLKGFRDGEFPIVESQTYHESPLDKGVCSLLASVDSEIGRKRWGDGMECQIEDLHHSMLDNGLIDNDAYPVQVPTQLYEELVKYRGTLFDLVAYNSTYPLTHIGITDYDEIQELKAEYRKSRLVYLDKLIEYIESGDYESTTED